MKPLPRFFYLASILLVAQTTSSDLLDWFTRSFLPLIPQLFMLIILVMFIYAILKAPLDVLSKARYVAPALLTAVTVDDYYTSIASTLFSLLAMIFMLLFPLILILLLYKSFFALVKSK